MKTIKKKQKHICECGRKVIILKPSMYGVTKRSKRRRQRRFVCRDDHYLCKKCYKELQKGIRKEHDYE